MIEPNPDCLNCRVLQTEVALLKAHLAGRDAVIRELTERSGGQGPEFSLRGLNTPARLVLNRGERDEAGEFYYRVSLEYWNLSASSIVVGIDAARFLAAFEELAQEAAGWEGRKTMTSLDGDLAISWEYQGANFHPEVWAHVRLANDWHEPLWVVELSLELRPEMLAELAVQARTFFAND